MEAIRAIKTKCEMCKDTQCVVCELLHEQEKLGDREYFHMFSAKGNIKVSKKVFKLKKKNIKPKSIFDYDFFDKYFGKLKNNKKYAEVMDMRVREKIAIVLWGEE